MLVDNRSCDSLVSMVCCLNPDCQKPLNQDTDKFCQSCGTELISQLRNRFIIIKPLGRGGFGKTYLAEDRDKLNEKCVVKQLVYQAQGSRENKLIVDLFMREAEQLQQLWANPQIPSLFAYFEEGGYLYLVQQYVEGQDLLKELKVDGCFNDLKIQSLLQDLLPVFESIHQRQVIHRDIKPENIMRREGDGKLILIDFGVSKQLSKSIVSVAGTMVGSLGYAPPEQMESGIAQASSDLYSLGATCFHLMTGINPWSLWKRKGYGWVENWQEHLQGSISPLISRILTKLLRIEVSDRYTSAKVVLNDLVSSSYIDLESLEKLLEQKQSSIPLTVKINPTEHSSGLIHESFSFETVRVDSQGKIVDREISQASYFSENIGNNDILEMVLIPGGSFGMGSPSGELGRADDEGPQHKVVVPTFFMGKYPVTQAQWEAAMGSNPSIFKGMNLPVENVSWHDAIEFCKKLSQNSGKEYRLPSEAEWEYACRAGTATPFYFGETITSELANCGGSSYGSGPEGEYRGQTTDVSSFPPNAFGLYDMHGNVFEWCQDICHDNYEGAPIDGSAWLTNTGLFCNLVLRGGCFNYKPFACRSASRTDWSPDFRHPDFGFRVVCSLFSTLQ